MSIFQSYYTQQTMFKYLTLALLVLIFSGWNVHGRVVRLSELDALFGKNNNPSSNNNTFDGDAVYPKAFPRAGGFPISHNGTECPENFTNINNFCWIQNSTYYLETKNKFLQYYDASSSMKDITVHYVTIRAWTGENDISGNIPVANISLTMEMRKNTSNSEPRPRAITLIFTDGRKQKFGYKDKLTFITNIHGKVIFSVLQEEDRLDWPVLQVTAPFGSATIDLKPNMHALDLLSQLNGEQLKKIAECNNNTEIYSDDIYNSTAHAINQLIKPELHSYLFDSNELNNEANGLHKREFKLEKLITEDKPYNNSNNRIRVFVQRKDHPMDILSAYDQMEQIGIVTSPLYDYIFQSSGKENSNNAIQLYKRTFLSEWLAKAKVAANSTKEWARSAFVDVPKTIFRRVGNKTDYMRNVTMANSDAAKDFIIASRDIVRIMPFGNIIADKMGMNELVNNITSSDVILLTPLTAGIELFVVGPKSSFKTLIRSFKQIGAIIIGLLKRIGVTLAAIFKTIRSTFNWDDILLNHRVLSAHFMKMVPFMKAEVTSKNGEFSNDFTNTVNRIGNLTDEATRLVANGSFHSLPDLISSANREIYRNITQNPQLQIEDGPEDIKTTLISDHIVNNLDSAKVDISEEDQKSILDVPREALQNIGTLGDESLVSLKTAYQKLKNELSQESWNISTILQTMNDLSKFTLTVALEKSLRAIMIIFDLVVSLFDRILRFHIRIPFITNLYETVITKRQSKLSMYDMFSLAAAMPLTIAFKAFHNSKNLFTKDEASVLIATENPEYYVENLVSLGLQVPGRSASHLRSMYRMTVSYILGTGFSMGQQIAAVFGSKVNTPFGLYFLRAPFEFMSILCNFPWSWYTNTLTKVGVNSRFLSWFFQFLPLFIGWPAVSAVPGFSIFPLITSLAVTIPNIYAVLVVWAQDLKLIQNNSAPDGATTLDVTMKLVGRLVRYAGMILIAAHPLPDAVGDIFRGTVFFGAVIQTARLYIDIPAGSVYSV